MEATIAVEVHDWEPGVHPVIGRCTVVIPGLGIGIAGVAIVKSVGHHIAWPTRPRHTRPRARTTGGTVSDPIIIVTDETAYTDLRHAIAVELRSLGLIR